MLKICGEKHDKVCVDLGKHDSCLICEQIIEFEEEVQSFENENEELKQKVQNLENENETSEQEILSLKKENEELKQKIQIFKILNKLSSEKRMS